MHKDPIPTNFAKLSLWCLNYKTQIGLNGESLGLSKDQIKQQQDICDRVIAAIANADAQSLAAVAANKSRSLVIKNDFGTLRKGLGHLKTNPVMTDDLRETFDIAKSNDLFDDTNYKSTLTTGMYAGKVRLKFKKLGVDGVNIYRRKKGDIEWALLGRFTKSPYDYRIVLATPGQPEHWEYRSYGVINDQEIGQPSDIVEIVFGG